MNNAGTKSYYSLNLYGGFKNIIMGITTIASLGKLNQNNIVEAEPEIVESTPANNIEYDPEVPFADTYFGHIPKNSQVYVTFNTIEEKEKKKDKKKITLKKAKEEIVERQSKINYFKAKLAKLNQSKDADAQLITQLNLKIHKETAKIRKLERMFDINANMYTPTTPTKEKKPETFKEKWIAFWEKVKDFIATYSKELASVASVAALIIVLLLI